jgi:hypothetical protein
MASLLIQSSVIDILSASVSGSFANYVLTDSSSLPRRNPRTPVIMYRTPNINVAASQNCSRQILVMLTVLGRTGSTPVPTPPSVISSFLASMESDRSNSVPKDFTLIQSLEHVSGPERAPEKAVCQENKGQTPTKDLAAIGTGLKIKVRHHRMMKGSSLCPMGSSALAESWASIPPFHIPRRVDCTMCA